MRAQMCTVFLTRAVCFGLDGKDVLQESCYMAFYKGHVRNGGIYKPVLKEHSTGVSQRHVVHVSSTFIIFKSLVITVKEQKVKGVV